MEAYTILKASDVKNGKNFLNMVETQVESPENLAKKEAELEANLGFTLQGTLMEKDDEGEQKLIDGQRVGRKSVKTFRSNDTESEISVSDQGLKLEEEKYMDQVLDMDYKDKKAEGSTALDPKYLEIITHHSEEKKEHSLREEVGEIHADSPIAAKNGKENVDTCLNSANFGTGKDLKSEFSNTVQKIYPEQDDSKDYSSHGHRGEASPKSVTRNNVPNWTIQNLDVGMEEIEASDFKDRTEKLFDRRDLYNEECDEACNEKLKIGNTYVHKGINTFSENLPTGKTVCNFPVESNNANCICIRQKRRVVENLNIICNLIKTFFVLEFIYLRGKAALTYRAAHDQLCIVISINFVQLSQLIRSEHGSMWIGNIQVLLEVTSATEWKRCYICAQKAFFLIAQSQREVSLQLHSMESLILVTWSPSFNMVTIVYGQPQITITHIYDQGSSSLVMKREASTVPNQSHGSMVLPSGEDAVAEQSSSSREVHVKHKGSAADLKELQQKPSDIKGKVSEDQDISSSGRKLHTRKSWKEDSWKWKSILKEKLEPELEDTGQLSVNDSQMNGKEGDYGFISFFKGIRQRHIKIRPFRKVYAYLRQLNSCTNYICPENYMCYVYVLELVPRRFIRQNNIYQNVNSRIATFPIHFGNRVTLAQAGFLYDAATDTVVCPWCGVLVDVRNLAEDPVNLHSSTCEFRVRNHQVNIQVAGATSSPARPASDLNVLPALVQPATRQSIDRYESNIMSEQLLKASDGSNNAPLPDAEFSQSDDIRCREEEAPSGLQTDVGGYVSGLNPPSVTAHAAGVQAFQIVAPRSAQDEQLHANNGINNKQTSPVNLHKGGGDARSVELPTIGSPSETLMNPSGGIVDIEQWSSGRGEYEMRVDETCIQRTSSANANSLEEPPSKHPQYAARNIRIHSYQGWPAELRQRPEEMAECGFYYEGLALATTFSHLFPIGDPSGPLTRPDDCVRCFHCGVGMRQWIREDDPWIEHVRWSPKCLYVHKMKGPTFVQRAVEMIQRSAATNNGEENDSSENNAVESADDKNKDAKDEDEEKEATNELEPSTNPEIMREYQELSDANLCKICFESKLRVIFLPCGHMVTCTNCSPFFKKCPMCRGLIREMVKAMI